MQIYNGQQSEQTLYSVQSWASCCFFNASAVLLNTSIPLSACLHLIPVSIIYYSEQPSWCVEQTPTLFFQKHQWAIQWFLIFSSTKSESILFTRKQNKQQHPLVVMDHQTVNEVNTQKHLDITFSNDCTWHDYIECMYAKFTAWSRTDVIKL